MLWAGFDIRGLNNDEMFLLQTSPKKKKKKNKERGTEPRLVET